MCEKYAYLEKLESSPFKYRIREGWYLIGNKCHFIYERERATYSSLCRKINHSDFVSSKLAFLSRFTRTNRAKDPQRVCKMCLSFRDRYIYLKKAPDETEIVVVGMLVDDRSLLEIRKATKMTINEIRQVAQTIGIDIEFARSRLYDRPAKPKGRPRKDRAV